MREIRPSGLEGGETQLNASSLPLSKWAFVELPQAPDWEVRRTNTAADRENKDLRQLPSYTPFHASLSLY